MSGFRVTPRVALSPGWSFRFISVFLMRSGGSVSGGRYLSGLVNSRRRMLLSFQRDLSREPESWCNCRDGDLADTTRRGKVITRGSVFT
jgi:hypothetical protein